jgi:hypothetical protein
MFRRFRTRVLRMVAVNYNITFYTLLNSEKLSLHLKYAGN